jgi:hypothetical protein
LANREVDLLGELLTATTIEVCERLAIPYKSANINVVQLDLDIRQTVPSLAKVMWDYFYAFHRHNFYCIAVEQKKHWASEEELLQREAELNGKKKIFYEQLEVFIALTREAAKNSELVLQEVATNNSHSPS